MFFIFSILLLFHFVFICRSLVGVINTVPGLTGSAFNRDLEGAYVRKNRIILHAQMTKTTTAITATSLSALYMKRYHQQIDIYAHTRNLYRFGRSGSHLNAKKLGGKRSACPWYLFAFYICIHLIHSIVAVRYVQLDERAASDILCIPSEDWTSKSSR